MKTIKIDNSIVCGINAVEGSKAEKVLKVYEKIDKEINEHYNRTKYSPVCRQGCSECCHDNFPISEIEFDLILAELKKWDNKDIINLVEFVKTQWGKMIKENPNYKKLIEQENSNLGKLTMEIAKSGFSGEEYPCIFLDKELHKCRIYNVRPIICRTYGTSFYEVASNKSTSLLRRIFEKLIGGSIRYRICSNIGGNKKAKKWQADISNMCDTIDSINSYKDKKTGKTISIQVYPIVYYLYRTFFIDKTKLNIKDYNYKFIQSEEKYIEMLFKRFNVN